MIGYLYLTGKLQSSQSTFKGIFKGRSHFMIPVGLTAFMLIDNKNTRSKTNSLINDSKNVHNIDIAVRKFICDTSQK